MNMKKDFYTIKGYFSHPELPIKDFVDIEELVYFNQIQPIPSDNNNPIFIASDIEAIGIKIYHEYLEAKEINMKKKFFKLNRFPFLKQKLDYYLIKNPEFNQNHLFSRFLEEEIHLNVFVLSLFNDKYYTESLNQLFKEFYFEYRFKAYLNQILYFEAITFSKKRSQHHKREALILEQPIGNDRETTLLDTIADTETIRLEGIDGLDSLDSYLSDDQLYQAFKQLTNHQQKILYLSFVKLLKDVEIAMVLNVSQQAVSKTRKTALEKIRKAMGVRT